MKKADLLKIVNSLNEEGEYKATIYQNYDKIVPVEVSKPIIEIINGNPEIVGYDKVLTYKVIPQTLYLAATEIIEEED